MEPHPHRFPVPDILAVVSLVQRRTRAGMWTRIEREMRPESDVLMIYFARRQDPMYRLERDKTGWTYLVYCHGNDWRLVACGSMDDCLRRFHPYA